MSPAFSSSLQKESDKMTANSLRFLPVIWVPSETFSEVPVAAAVKDAGWDSQTS